jgi:hypothetical protein
MLGVATSLSRGVREQGGQGSQTACRAFKVAFVTLGVVSLCLLRPEGLQTAWQWTQVQKADLQGFRSVLKLNITKQRHDYPYNQVALNIKLNRRLTKV